MGKYFKKFLDKDLWEMYYKTYSDGDCEHLWESIFIACDLFRKVGLKVGEHFQYNYPHEDDKNMTNYLIQVKQLPKDAKEIPYIKYRV
jgi:aminoglycoside 6-adenylyltransferase